MDTICYIFGASSAEDIFIDKSSPSFIIAADGGLKALNKHGIAPDLIVGDFDSLGYIPTGNNIIFHKPEKDDTDTMLAIKEGLNRGFKKFVLYGCLGGRLDHTIANLSALSYIAKNGGCGFIVGDGNIITAINNGSITLSKDLEGYVSVFCFGKDAEGISIKNLKYELENATLTADFPLGVSNEFIGKEATVSVKNGTLLIMWKDLRPLGSVPNPASL